MTRSIVETKDLWVFGRRYRFCLVQDPTRSLQPKNFGKCCRNNPSHTHKKTQIVLHSTGGAGMPEAEYGNWANKAASAHLIVDRSRPANVRASRPSLPSGVFSDFAGFVDAYKVMGMDKAANHASGVNDFAIGIEHSNLAHGMKASKDENRYLALRQQVTSGEYTIDMATYEVYEDAQYSTMILLLRALCIDHRIPRQFFGDNWTQRWSMYLEGQKDPNTKSPRYQWYVKLSPAEQNRRKTSIMGFRGIIRHHNVHAEKPCPGVIADNRLFRGIIDEWWLPLEMSGTVRDYYSGPFWNPRYVGDPTKPALFWWDGSGKAEGVTWAKANIPRLLDTRSYFDLGDVPSYYQDSETGPGGFFPIGTNRVWHGGVHLGVPATNPVVYAAASGTIVAARISSNPAVESSLGSQRFVLLRHAVYWKTTGSPPQIDYSSDPSLVWSLYMHLAPIPDPYAEDPRNPRWYNQWIRTQTARNGSDPDSPYPDYPRKEVLDAEIGLYDDEYGKKGCVFNPDVEVSVGDVLGTAGVFEGRPMIHFEIVSHRNDEITAVGTTSARDLDTNTTCDAKAINDLLVDSGVPGIDLSDLRPALPALREFRVLHRSEWAWRGDEIQPVSPDPQLGTTASPAAQLSTFQNWDVVSRFMWLDDAVKANSDLATQLGQDGFFWHYHPITFMRTINQRIENDGRVGLRKPPPPGDYPITSPNTA